MEKNKRTVFELQFYRDWEKQKTIDVFKNHNKEIDENSEAAKLWLKLRRKDNGRKD